MMNAIFSHYINDRTPFCIFQKDEQVTILRGYVHELNSLDDIRAYQGGAPIKSVSMIPYCQIRERGFDAPFGKEPILTLDVKEMLRLDVEQFLQMLPDDAPLELDGELRYNFSDAEYEEIVAQVIDKEIKNGEGSNFLLSRKTQGCLKSGGIPTALTILKRFINNEFGAYMSFCFFDGEKYFVGASPERHLSISKGIAYLNPISGTMPKKQTDFKQALVSFLQDPKEIHELFQVVDEELKMMAKVCKRGGDVLGPFLKEMRTLIHTEYLLKGETDADPIDALRETMFAPTMIGSPLENACRVIRKYETDSRRYYSSAMLILGDDEDGEAFMDSAITIRTMEMDLEGNFTVQAGASIVRDSVPKNERIEVTTKCLGAIKAISESQQSNPILDNYLDPYVEQTFMARNEHLSTFWLEKQQRDFRDLELAGKRVLIVNNEDDFAYMIAHVLEHLGLKVQVKKISDVPDDITQVEENLVILGPGPGDPENTQEPRILKLNLLAQRLLNSDKPFMGICFGHQVICRNLGMSLERLEIPFQGVQKEILLFGEKEYVGFYNTFTAVADEFNEAGIELSVNAAAEVNAIKGPNFQGFQFHVESVLTTNGIDILRQALRELI